MDVGCQSKTHHLRRRSNEYGCWCCIRCCCRLSLLCWVLDRLVSKMIHNSHNWRYSDSSLYDAVCTQCNCTDTSDLANYPCNNPPKPSRLVELAREARLKGSSELSLSNQELEFAKRLIRECADIANQNFNSGFAPVGDDILKHFDLK